MKIRLILLVVLLAQMMACQDEVLPVPSDKVEEVVIASAINGEQYRLYIYLPEGYESNTRDYPVLYQLDGDTSTGSVIEDSERLMQDGQVRQYIIVAIDYQGDNMRERDFTPTHESSFNDSGGAADYYRFLVEELLPYVNDRYRTDLTFGNTLRGHSLGGLFAAYALLRSAESLDAFTHYIIESPSLWWDDNYILQQENDYAVANGDLEAKAYISVGELEAATMKITADIFEEKLSGRQYASLRLGYEVLGAMNHLDVRENDRGLQFIFGL